MNANYENLRKFITTDHKTHKIMFEMKPPQNTDAINFDAIVKYTNNAYDNLKYIINEFKKCIAPYDSGIFSKKIDELSQIWLTKLINAKTDLDKLQKFYLDCIVNMSEEVVSSAKEELVGYSLFSNVAIPLNKCKTVNEILHIMHSFVINNQYILSSPGVINKKELSNGCPVTTYGKPNELSEIIFENFPENINVGDTTIVSLGELNKVVMMVRDKGHALSIEIDEDENDILVSYFIPKLCNIDMINSLPGVIKVKENNNIHTGTTGKFVTTKDKLVNDLYNFIEKVPMDDDMPILNEYIRR